MISLLVLAALFQTQPAPTPPGQTVPGPAQQVAGPYDPNHVIPPGLSLTMQQRKALAPLLPPPGTANASEMVERNKAKIEKITGPEEYQKILVWEKKQEPAQPPKQ